ncbi:replication initiator [Nocardia arthritidis]|uniref:Replication initiator protein n=1 Tax=Nocardia arthritidis TaxID=228602 RepID=A0A6G9Y8A1_9NOCA|nr:replication initiator [Nocardia arthritidis]QIS09283.1 replication initiator protein [Nocardia arthritidis]
MTDPQSGKPVRETAADRRAKPSFLEIAQTTAEKFGVCKRPVPMRVEDPKTWTVSYIATPCKSTIASVCPACAAQARYVRMTQCREGWHLDHEPVQEKREPSEWQRELLTARADLVDGYHKATAAGDEELAAGFVEVIQDIDAELRETGVRGPLPPLEPRPRKRRTRSTRRRQDVPDLPRKTVSRNTIRDAYAGGHRPGMLITLTMPSYGRINRDGARDADGKVCSDGSPCRPQDYDYTRAARDIVHVGRLFDRWIQNMRRAVGRDLQYFAVVEPQRRGAPHLHVLIRTDLPRELVVKVTEATYHQVWWPHFDHEVYTSANMPVWDEKVGTFVDPRTHRPLTGWDAALDAMDAVDVLEPAHEVRFGVQIDPRHIRGVIAGEQADKAIRYVTKYLTKSIAEIVEPQSVRAAEHYDRLHAELCHTPCSPRCGVWLRYGIVPKGATAKTIPGRCRGKAHRRDTLGLPGRRVLVSRRWTGKTLPDHRADRTEFVRQLLAAVGISKPDTTHLRITPVEPGDQHCPPREHLITAAIAQRTRDRAEYLNALLAASPPGTQEHSAIEKAA